MEKYNGIIRLVVILALVIVAIVLSSSNVKTKEFDYNEVATNSYYTEDEPYTLEEILNEKTDEIVKGLKAGNHQVIYNMLTDESKEKFDDFNDFDNYFFKERNTEYVTIKSNEILNYTYDYYDFDYDSGESRRIKVLIGKEEENSGVYSELNVDKLELTFVLKSLCEIYIEI